MKELNENEEGERGGGGAFYKYVWQLKGLPEAQEP